MSKYYLFSLFVLILSIQLSSASIQGTVYQIQETSTDDLRTPLINATLKFYNGDNYVQVFTNESGYFFFEPKTDINKVEVYNGESQISDYFNYSSEKNETLWLSFNLYGANNLSGKFGIMSANCPDYSIYHNAYSLFSSWVNSPMNFSKRPVLLVHGWSNDATDKNETWGNLENELKNQGYEVWRLQYWSANLSDEKNAGMIRIAINELLNKGYAQNGINKIDVVAHSNGGLVTLGYIQNMGESSCGFPRGYNHDVRKLVTIASPLHGTFFGNLINEGFHFSNILGCSFTLDLFRESEATHDFEIGSNFTWELNSLPLNNEVNYLTIGGIGSYFAVACYNQDEENDGAVPLISTNLLDKHVPHITLGGGCDSSSCDHSALAKLRKTGKIISAFLNSSSVSVIKSYLGSEDYYIAPDDSSANPTSRGWIILNILSNRSNPRPYLINGDQKYNLTQNPNSKKWFYLNPEGGIDNFKLDTGNLAHYHNFLLNGMYDIFIDGIYYPIPLQIRSPQVTLFTVDLIPPSVTLLSPLNDSYTRLSLNYFSANLTDNYNLSNTNLYIWNETLLTGTNFTLVSGTNNITNLSFEFPREGVYSWNYQVNDTGMNSVFGESNFSITYDFTPPSIYFISPTPIDGYYNSSNISLEIFVNDNLSGLANYTISLYNSTSLVRQTTRVYGRNGGGGGSGGGGSLQDGNYSFNATAFDFAGNVNSTETRNIVIDTTPPLITNLSIQNGSVVTNLSNLIINFRDISGLDFSQTKFNITLNNASYSDYTISNLSNTLIIAFTKIHNGNYKINLIATDILNNTGNITSLYFNKINSINDINTNLQNISMTIGNSVNVSQSFSGLQNVSFMQNNSAISSFIWDYSYGDLDLSNISIIKQESGATEGSALISGIDLTSQNQTKTVYVDKISSTANKICIKDQEITSISEISSACDGTNEIPIQCPGNSGQYVCELVENGTRYKISGLSHSGIKEYTYTTPQPPANNDGGGGGGGGGGTPAPKNTTNATLIKTNQSIVVNQNISNVNASGNSTNQTNQQNITRGIGLTGAVIGTTIKRYAWPIFVFFLVIVGAWIGLNVVRKKKAYYSNTFVKQTSSTQNKAISVITTKCSICGKTNSKWRRFCLHCGNSLRI